MTPLTPVVDTTGQGHPLSDQAICLRSLALSHLLSVPPAPGTDTHEIGTEIAQRIC